MANTYTQLYIHLVFAVKNRDAVIKRDWKDGLEKYITGIIQNHKHKLLAIGTMPDRFAARFPSGLWKKSLSAECKVK